MTFALTSPALVEQGTMPDKYTLAKGENTSPPLEWSGAPEGTQSFVLTCVDPDVPWGNFGLPGPGTLYGDLFIHWMAYDLPATVASLPAGASGSLSGGAKELDNTAADFGSESPFYQYRKGYIGCAPPPGDRAHRYIFTLYALNTGSLGVAESGRYNDLEEALKGKVIAATSLMVYFGQKAE